MSKRGSKSFKIIEVAKSITLGKVRRPIPKMKKSQKGNMIIPTPRDIKYLNHFGVILYVDFDDKNLGELILIADEKINQLVTLSESNLKPRRLKWEKKTREDLIGLINVLQNKLLLIAQSNYSTHL